jgi:chitinase
MRIHEFLRSRGRAAATAVACAALAATGLVAAGAGEGSASAAVAGTGSVPAAATSGGIKVAYFDQWSIYQNAFYVKNLDTEGIAGNLNYLIYDFENINPTAPTTASRRRRPPTRTRPGRTTRDAGDGAEDMDADYGKPFPANEAVSGVADTSTQTWRATSTSSRSSRRSTRT